MQSPTLTLPRPLPRSLPGPLSRPLSRRALGLGAAASAVATGLVAACGRDEPAPAAGGPPDQVTYVTGFGLFGREGYAHVADAKGFFAEENLAVTIEPGAGGDPNTQAVLSGQAQFTAVDSTGVYIRHGIGAETDTVIVSAVQQLPTISLISVDITEPYELVGKVVGASPGGITETLFPTYAQLAGFDASEVRFEPVDAPQLPAALAAGQVDAIALFLMGKPAVEAATGREVHILPYSDYLTDLFGTVHITTRKLAEQNPALVRRFNNAILRGLEYAIDNPAEAGAILAEAVPETNPEVAAAELEIMAPYVRSVGAGEPLGAMAEPKVMRGLALLQALGEIPGGIEPADVVAFDLVPGGGEWK